MHTSSSPDGYGTDFAEITFFYKSLGNIQREKNIEKKGQSGSRIKELILYHHG
jgi:hypothetical protein